MIASGGEAERRFVRIAEGQVHLRSVQGDDNSPPIFLLHASPSSSRFMVPLAAAICEATGRTVHAPDTLGNGDSPAPVGDEPDIAYFADSVVRLADAMGIDKFAVYGSHTGARIACELAAAFPDRIEATFLDGIKEYEDDLREKVIENYAPQVKPDDHGTHMVWAFHFVRDQAIYFPHFMRDPEHRLPGFMPPAQILHEAAIDVLKTLDTYAKPYIAAFRYRATERLSDIKGPVLFMKAERELAVLNEAVDKLAALVPAGTTVEVASAPQDKARAIARFLQETHS
ncbi:alpha/beta fold hydrolase [Croceicoccus gelatinilyticus]|uniref:alpha/beta fold hydrolase n=1 Tax=Croceicoccus gelatinilyticus TaxID=2835536 RepID=UPI001BD02B7F|nr:alpha/beta fold hydrolase [Croceicoccus gelatinilyticus]